MTMAGRLALALVCAGLSAAACDSKGASERDAGEAAYAKRCAYCHNADGTGTRVAPPLDAAWLGTGTLARIILHGMEGRVEVAGETHDRKMVPLGSLPDDEIARVMTYVQSRFGSGSGAVSADDVNAVRAATRDRHEPWTADELRELP